jgi:hypothetical protein
VRQLVCTDTSAQRVAVVLVPLAAILEHANLAVATPPTYAARVLVKLG